MKHSLSLPTKFLAFAFAALLLTHAAIAQEAIDLEEAQKIALKLVSAATASADQPFNVEADPDKPVGFKGADAGLIIVPDKRLTAEAMANAGKTLTPVAQLWTYKITLSSGGQSVDSGKTRTITVGDGDKSRDVQLFLVGVTKNEQGALELVVFGKGNEPVLRAPVTQLHAAKQNLPIEATGRKTTDTTATLTVDLFGQYTADIAVAKAND